MLALSLPLYVRFTVIYFIINYFLVFVSNMASRMKSESDKRGDKRKRQAIDLPIYTYIIDATNYGQNGTKAM